MLRSLPRTLVARYAPPQVETAPAPHLAAGQDLRGASPGPGLLFAFGGRNQYAPGMGCDLYAHEPVFRATVEECEPPQHQSAGRPSIISHFAGPPEAGFLC